MYVGGHHLRAFPGRSLLQLVRHFSPLLPETRLRSLLTFKDATLFSTLGPDLLSSASRDGQNCKSQDPQKKSDPLLPCSRPHCSLRSRTHSNLQCKHRDEVTAPIEMAKRSNAFGRWKSRQTAVLFGLLQTPTLSLNNERSDSWTCTGTLGF